MPRRNPDHASRAAPSHLRRSIAVAAARLMAEGGARDYGSAKRKAAHQLGATDSAGLPTNEEIENELRSYHALFDDEEQREHLLLLRHTAVDVMELLADFHPCLTGHVLDGTAGRHSPIELELFADSSKDVEIFLLSRGIDYAIDEMQRRGPESAETRLHLEWEEVYVHLLVFPLTAERSSPRNPHTGRGHARARLPAVQALLREQP